MTYCKQYDIIIDRKEVNALSKRKKKRGNKAEPDSYLNLVTAILNLVIAILLLIEKQMCIRDRSRRLPRSPCRTG